MEDMESSYSQKAKRYLLLSCALSCFVIWLDVAIVNTAMPAIEVELSASILQLQWIMNIFNFAIAILIVTFGRLSDHIGRKVVNMGGVVLFGLVSLAAGLAPNPTWLIVCRFLQGAASAAILPSAMALITRAFPPHERGKAVGIWTGIGGIGMAAGPAVGGFIVSALNWRWIFYINVPFAIISVIFSAFSPKENKEGLKEMPIDLKGAFLLTCALGFLIGSLMHAPEWGWTSGTFIMVFASSFFFFACFYFVERKALVPIIPFQLLLNRFFFSPALVMFNLVFVFTSSIFLEPLYLIQIRGQFAYQAGLCMLAMTSCIAFFSFISGGFIKKFGAKTLIVAGLILFCAGTLSQTHFEKDTPLIEVILAFMLIGAGWGIARPSATSSAVEGAPHKYAGVVSGVLWSIQNGGGALGIAIVLTIFRKVYLADSTVESFMAGYHLSMWILSCLTFAILILTALYLKIRQHHA
jgi:EmrB/QacA subfamily drug resistance transporter